MNPQYHLVIVTPLPPAKSSIGQYGYYLAEALAATKTFAQITILAQVEASTRETDLSWPLHVERIWKRDQPGSSLRIIRRLRQLKPDLVWYNLGASIFGKNVLSNVSGLLCPFLTRRLGIASVVTMHEMVDAVDFKTLHVPGGELLSCGTSIMRFMLTQTDLVCVTLERHAKWLAGRDPRTPIVHIPHGIFNRPQVLPDSPDLNLLVFGNLAPYKGLETVLEAFSSLRQKYPSIGLTIAGTEHPRFPGYIERIRKELGKKTAMKWAINVPEHELHRLFAHSTLVVIPNLATTGSSSVLYRAVGWGRAVMASDLPELRAVAEEEQFRINFFPGGNSAALARSLESLLFDPKKRKAQVRHNFGIVVDHLTVEHTSQAYLRAFEWVLAM
jgi:glycosyltransferase involved in cell wall biosynthesis